MADEKKEWISALADGELTGDELKRSLDALRDDPVLLDSWTNYHLVRDALHSNLEARVMPDLSTRVAAALEDEPVILAPQRKARPWLRHAAGLAVAASVTGIAIIGITGINDDDNAMTSVAVNQSQNSPTQEYVRMEPANMEPSSVAEAQAPESQVPNDGHLAPYLVNHNEYAVSSGMHGMLPYVRIVGHKTSE